jgi:ATP-dependent Clp protease adaptor protein ClpS
MADPPDMPEPPDDSGAAEPQKPAAGAGSATKPRTDDPKPRQLPPWKVLLHNDDVHEMTFVVETIISLVPLSRTAAMQRMMEAHQSGVALLLTTHQERAELYKDQFASKGLTVSIEPAEA